MLFNGDTAMSADVTLLALLDYSKTYAELLRTVFIKDNDDKPIWEMFFYCTAHTPVSNLHKNKAYFTQQYTEDDLRR